jgi:hypothetical protein
MNQQVPSQLSTKILDDIKNRLNPDLKIILLKVFFIHLMTAVFTLSICPQYGFAVFKTDLNLMTYFMYLGVRYCEFACGIFLTGTSMFSVWIFLSRDEWRVLRFKKIVTCLFILLQSIGLLVMANPQLFYEFSFLWIIGTITGTFLGLKPHLTLHWRS